MSVQTTVVSLEWARWIDAEFRKLQEKVDSLVRDLGKTRNEVYQHWLIVKRLLEPRVEFEVLQWQTSHPSATETDLRKWIRSFATSDPELLLYYHAWQNLVKKRVIEMEHHGRGYPRTYSVKNLGEVAKEAQ